MAWDKSLWPALSPLLDKALDLDEAARTAFLASLRHESPHLADALEQLVAEHRRVLASNFLAAPLALAGGATVSLAGQAVGPYTLERPLGLGGMGTVWLGRRNDGRFEGAVAIKLVNLAVLDRQGQERFQREGTLLARLSHPHIARLLDAGVTPGGQPYLVLEYVPGTRIDRHADAQRLTVRERLHLFLQVADAVAHAHAHLVVHRDLKPSNIFVDDNGQVKLLDFGIAAILDDQRANGPSTVTLALGRALTPEFAAPEQVLGGAVATTSDVYALGVLLYQLVTGRHPTATDGASDAEVLRALAEREPARASDAVQRLTSGTVETTRLLDDRRTTKERLQRACRGDLDTILGKALKKRVDERYPTVAALAADVRAHLHDQPVAAQPDSLWYRTRKLVARRRVESVSAAVVMVGLMAGSGLALWQARASGLERDRAIVALRRAEATNDFSAFLLSQARPGDRPMSNAEVLARGEALVGARYANDPELRVHLWLTLADRYQENQQFVGVARVLARAFDESRPIADAGLRAYATCYAGYPAMERGDYAAALTSVDTALSEMSAAPNAAEYEGRCRVIESIAARRGGHLDRAVQAAERAVQVETTRAAASGRIFEPLSALATAYSASDRYADADGIRRRQEAVLAAEGQLGTLTAAVLFNNWSVQNQDAGQMLAAVALGERAVRTASTADSENGASLTMLTTYANALVATGHNDAATAILEESLAKARTAGAVPRLARALSTAVASATALGDLTRAARYLDEWRRLKLDAYSRGLLELGEARLALASGQVALAIARSGTAVDTLSTATPGKVSLVGARILAADALSAGVRYAEALAMAQAAVSSSQERNDRPWSYDVGHGLLQTAVAKRGLGDRDAALADLRSALNHLRATVGPDAVATRRAEALTADMRAQAPSGSRKN